MKYYIEGKQISVNYAHESTLIEMNSWLMENAGECTIDYEWLQCWQSGKWHWEIIFKNEIDLAAFKLTFPTYCE